MCPESEPLVHAYLDGELTGVDRESFELHLLDCATCAQAAKAQVRFKAALRGHLPRPPVPESLRLKVTRELAKGSPGESRGGWFEFPKLTPAFAAVAVVGLLVVVTKRPTSAPVIQQALRAHSVELPMDVEAPDCERVASWFRGKLPFIVHPPRLDRVMQASAISSQEEAGCQGGRLINVKDNFAAYLAYKVGAGKRINVTVFEGEDESLETPRRRRIAGMDVYFGSAQGASTAAFRGHDGLNYVLTADLDENALASVIQAALR